MTTLLPLATALLAVVGGADAGADFAFATLDGGVHVGFALVRSGAQADAGSIGEAVVPGSNNVSRVLFDEASGSYFGYELEAEPLALRGRFKVVVKPLGPRVAEELGRRIACSGCPPPRQLAAFPARFPAPRVISDGELFTLDLLVNPTTREKILDVVVLASRPVDVATMRSASQRAMQAQQHIESGSILLARKAFPEAILAFEKALDLNPRDAVIHNRLGICYQHNGRPEQAQDHYERALEIDPEYAAVWNNLASLAHNQGDFEEAIERYERALSLKPDLATTYKNIGSAYFAMSRFEQGLEAYQAAYRLDPSILQSSGTGTINALGVDIALQNFYFAKICAAAGGLDAALQFLRVAREYGFEDFEMVARDPDFRALVQDPRYGAVRDAR
jgi:Tfp pilus assembly protein PilF